MSSAPGDVYEFGPFRLEPAERRLARDGETVTLPPKVFDLLAMLVARAGRLVTREDLLKEIWRDTFVEEANLSYTVSLLRKALGDDTDPHRYIETVQKRGYRFAAPVRRLPGQAAEIQPDVAPPAAVNQSSSTPAPLAAPLVTRLLQPLRKRSWWYLAAGTAALALIAVWLLFGSQPRSDRFVRSPQFARFDVIVPEDITVANIDQPVISPDGTHVAFAGSARGKRQLWVRAINSSATVALPGTDEAWFPAWSPDSRALAFFTGGKLKKVDARGGPVVTLCDAPAIGGAWGEGVVVFSEQRIHRVADSGGAPVPITAFDASRNETQHFVAGFLSDGQRFVFSDGGEPPTFYVSRADGAAERQMLGKGSLADIIGGVSALGGYLLYVQGRHLMVQRFDEKTLQLQGLPVKLADDAWGKPSASKTGTVVFRSGRYRTRQPTWIGRQGMSLGIVSTADVYTHVELSPSGTRAILVRSAPYAYAQTDLLMVDLRSGITSRLTEHAGTEADPAWSPNERSIAYSSTQAGIIRPFQKDLQTGREEQLAESTDPLVIDDWTLDGRFLILRKVARRRLFALTLDDRKLRQISEGVAMDQSQVSPDGRWIAFNSHDSKEWQVYVARFPDFTDKRQVSVDGGVQPRWRADGRELFYLTPDGTLKVVEYERGAEREFKAPQTLFKTVVSPALPGVSEYDVAADGNRFLILQDMPATPQVLTFLVNWTEVLSR